MKRNTRAECSIDEYIKLSKLFSMNCLNKYFKLLRRIRFRLWLKRFACGFIKASLALVVGLIPAALLYLVALPRLAQATGATWLEALLWITALAGVCGMMGIVDYVDERSNPKCSTAPTVTLTSKRR